MTPELTLPSGILSRSRLRRKKKKTARWISRCPSTWETCASKWKISQATILESWRCAGSRIKWNQAQISISLLSTGGYNGRISAEESKSWQIFGPEKQKQFDSLVPIREFEIDQENLCEKDYNENNDFNNKNIKCNCLLSMEQIDKICASCSTCEWNDSGESFACYHMESKEGKKIGHKNIIYSLLSKWK